MRLVFAGLEKSIAIDAGHPAVLQIENPTLFTRVARSLQDGDGAESLEGFSAWVGDEEVPFSKCSLVITDPLQLPWDDRRIMTAVVNRLEREFLEDEDLRKEVERAQRALSSKMLGLSFGLDSMYQFSIEWDFKRYLKNVGFGAMVQPDESYLDNLMNFISLVLDSGFNKVLVFVNLKTFLSKTDIEKLYEHVFYTNISMLLIENKVDMNTYTYENKRVIDQDLLEF
jgi:CRISPR-associated protein Csn2